MIVVFNGKLVSEVRDFDEAGQTIDMFATRKGFNACKIINTANKTIGELKNDNVVWAMEPNPDLKYIMVANDGTIITDNLRFIEAKHTIIELS